MPVSAPDLDALLRRVAQRDREAFAAFYDATRSRVYGMVLRVLRDRGYSEETTQDVYLQVWRTAEGYDPASGSALAWLLTLAHRPRNCNWAVVGAATPLARKPSVSV